MAGRAGLCSPGQPAERVRLSESPLTATPRAALSQARWVCVGRGPICAGKVLGLILSNTRAPAMLSQLCPPVVCLRPRGVCPLSSQPSAGEGVEGRFSEEAQGPPSTCTVTHTPHPERLVLQPKGPVPVSRGAHPATSSHGSPQPGPGRSLHWGLKCWCWPDSLWAFCVLSTATQHRPPRMTHEGRWRSGKGRHVLNSVSALCPERRCPPCSEPSPEKRRLASEAHTEAESGATQPGPPWTGRGRRPASRPTLLAWPHDRARDPHHPPAGQAPALSSLPGGVGGSKAPQRPLLSHVTPGGAGKCVPRSS